MKSNVGIVHAIPARLEQEIGVEKVPPMNAGIASHKIADLIERIHTIAGGEKRSGQENTKQMDYRLSAEKSTSSPRMTFPTRGKSTSSPRMTFPTRGKPTSSPRMTFPTRGTPTPSPRITFPTRGKPTSSPRMTFPTRGTPTPSPRMTFPTRGTPTSSPRNAFPTRGTPTSSPRNAFPTRGTTYRNSSAQTLQGEQSRKTNSVAYFNELYIINKHKELCK